MKTILRSLALVALCSVGITSCVYDDPYYGGGYGYGGGYSGYGPGYSSVSLGLYDTYPRYGGYGYSGYGYSPYRYSRYGSGHHHHHGGYASSRRGGSYPYASRVSRPTSFRGSGVASSPRSIPRVSPGSLSRPSSSVRGGSSLRSAPSSFRGGSSIRSAAPSSRGSTVSSRAAVSADGRRRGR